MKSIQKNILQLVVLIIIIISICVLLLISTKKAGAPITTTETTTTKPAEQFITVYYIALNDNGASGKLVGCGDSVVGLKIPITATSTPLSAALTMLFADKRQNIPQSSLYNALYQSDLKINSLSIVNGKATVTLSGKTSLGGVCDDPRFIAQIKETVLQFATIKEASITINGVPIESIGSEKGE